MKKGLLVLVLVISVFLVTGCGENEEKLYLLNWGEYMDQDLVLAFEDEYGVDVVYTEVGSNEEMEVLIKAGTTPYDIAFPSDYMVDKLASQDLLNEIDYDRLTAFDDVTIMDEVYNLYSDKDYASYLVPYFWGTIGIMYNLETVDEADLTGCDILFEQTDTYRIGMYDSARDAVASALFYLGYDVNSNVESELNEAADALSNANFTMFGEDNLKTQVIQGNLDMALVYSGDYFDELYAAEEDDREANFGYFVPDTTNVWVDTFVIPTTSTQTDLAYDFINFLLDEENATQNADWVGYAPVLEEVYAMLTSDEYGYDYDNYNPYPEGASREMYEFVSDVRYARLNDILNNAKVN
jgi:spermidine/putrescine-binding protein